MVQATKAAASTFTVQTDRGVGESDSHLEENRTHVHILALKIRGKPIGKLSFSSWMSI